MTHGEAKRMYSALPGWRWPHGAVDGEERERRSLREAICDLLGDASLSGEELTAAVREEWGDCGDAEVAAAIRELLHDRVIGSVVTFGTSRYALRGEP